MHINFFARLRPLARSSYPSVGCLVVQSIHSSWIRSLAVELRHIVLRHVIWGAGAAGW